MNGYIPPPRLWRVGLLLLVFVCLFGVLGFRLHRLQIEEGGHLAHIAEKQRVRTWILPASRGSMFDASGAPIVVSQSLWTLSCDPKQMTDRLRATVEINRIVPEVSRDALRTQFECGKDGRTLRRGLNDEQAKAIIGLKLVGVELKREFARTYPGGAIAPHIVGFTNADGKGSAGIEQTLDARLAGTDGKETLQIDGRGRPIMSTGGTSIAPVPGANIQLTIAVAVQQRLEAVLDEAGAKHRPIGIAGLVIRPSTGEIVAMASWPSFDLNDRATFSPEAISNRAVQMVYEPGSTLKPLVAGAAVSEGLVTFQTAIFCENGRWTYRVGKSARTISDHSFKDGGHG
ncbi:MAG: penicillin-binding transpeptidase domain-containing protein, partial [Planctomycetota bacterium]